MITLHYLDVSLSLRILWLLEEIGQPYKLIRYCRDPLASVTPRFIKRDDPLGKSPVVEIEGHIITESGAIVEYLIRRFAPELEPAFKSADDFQYLQWIDFAQSSIIMSVVLKGFSSFQVDAGERSGVIGGHSQADFHNILGFLNGVLANKDFIVGNKLSGADFMLAFVVIAVVEHLREGVDYPHLAAYLQRLTELDNWKRALKLVQESEQEFRVLNKCADGTVLLAE